MGECQRCSKSADLLNQLLAILGQLLLYSHLLHY